MKDWLPLVTAMVVALPGVLAYLRVGRVAAQVQEVHVLMNSRLSELLELAKLEAHQRGVNEGVAAQAASAAHEATLIESQKEGIDGSEKTGG